MSSKATLRHTPEKSKIDDIFSKALTETTGDPIKLRSWYSNISTHLEEWFGEEGAATAVEMIDQAATENGISPSDLRPRPSESRSQLLARIKKIGLSEAGIVRQTNSYDEYIKAINLIEMQILEYASEADVLFVYEHLRQQFQNLGISERCVDAPPCIKEE